MQTMNFILVLSHNIRDIVLLVENSKILCDKQNPVHTKK